MGGLIRKSTLRNNRIDSFFSNSDNENEVDLMEESYKQLLKKAYIPGPK
jgi:hypothetical protein